MKRNKLKLTALALLLAVIMLFSACDGLTEQFSGLWQGDDSTEHSELISLDDIPAFSGSAYVEINGNVPFFTDGEITDESYESYGNLDGLGRCTFAVASIGTDLMPTEKREDLDFRPTGWHTVKYDFVDGKFLYNRCHLIGFQLTGENDNKYNLMTGTRYLNIEGMLDFENMIDDYVEKTENHVMYRVTPIFEGEELVARGVLMEGYSVEDEGEGICFCVYAYNVQPGVEIDYLTGKSWESGNTPSGEDTTTDGEDGEDGIVAIYVINTSTYKFHKPDCQYAESKNAKDCEDTYDGLIDKGYSPCRVCMP